MKKRNEHQITLRIFSAAEKQKEQIILHDLFFSFSHNAVKVRIIVLFSSICCFKSGCVAGYKPHTSISQQPYYHQQ